jgi:hypothetical protein
MKFLFCSEGRREFGWSLVRIQSIFFIGSRVIYQDAMFMQHFVHGVGTESAEYLDMTSGGVFVHCTMEERRSILDRTLSVTPLEDLQIKAPLFYILVYLF